MPAPVGSRGDIEAPWLLALHFHNLIYERPLVPSNMLGEPPYLPDVATKVSGVSGRGFYGRTHRTSILS